MAKTKKSKEQKTQDVKVERTSRELKIPLTEEQINFRRDEAATCRAELGELNEALETATTEFKAKKKEWKEEITLKENRRDTCLTEIKEKKSKALVECDEVMNFSTKKVEYWYPNHEAGEKLDERDFTPEEHQLRMFTEKAESIPSTGQNPVEHEAQVTQ